VLSRLKEGAIEDALCGLLVEECDLSLDEKYLRGSKREGGEAALVVLTVAGVQAPNLGPALGLKRGGNRTIED